MPRHACRPRMAGSKSALWTVAKELGHKNVSRIKDTYGHPSHYRPRGEGVEYRIPQEEGKGA